jgi:hypothetical protein
MYLSPEEIAEGLKLNEERLAQWEAAKAAESTASVNDSTQYDYSKIPDPQKVQPLAVVATTPVPSAQELEARRLMMDRYPVTGEKPDEQGRQA